MKFSVLALALATLTTSAGEFYIGCQGGKPGEQGIYLAELDETNGEVTQPALVANFPGAGFQALSPDGSLLASTASGERKDKDSQNVRLFTVGTDGSLTAAGSSNCGPGRTCHVSFDHEGKIVFAANYGAGAISSSLITPEKTLSGTAVSLFHHEGSGPNKKRQKAPHAHSIYPGPSNTFAYAPDLGIDQTVIYALEPDTGTLTRSGQAQSTPGGGPRHMKFSQDGKHAYILNELTTSVEVFEVQADGSLTQLEEVASLPDSSDSTGMTCSEIRISPSGAHLYTANRDTAGTGRDSISVFRISPGSGSITRTSTTAAGVIIPRNITLSPSGKYLIASGQKSNSLSIFRIDSETGALTQTAQSVALPAPMCITFR